MTEQKRLHEDRLLMSFYADPTNQALHNRKHTDKHALYALEKRFQKFHLKARLVSYTDKLARYYSQEFDKKKRFHQNQLQLDSLQEGGDDVLISLIPSKELKADDAVVQQISDILPTEKMQIAYAELSEEKKSVLTHLVFDQLNNKEIAKKLNCSPQNVSKLKINALKGLRRVEANERIKETST